MTAGAAKLLELLFVIALVGGWGGYELWSLRRDRSRDDAARRESGRSERDAARDDAGTPG